MKEIVDDAARESEGLDNVVVWRRLGDDDDRCIGRDLFWDELVAGRAGDARTARGRLRASVPAHVHVRDDRPAEGRPARPGWLSRLDRPGSRPTRPTQARRRAPLLDGHGLDHGPVDRRRRRRDGLRRSCTRRERPDWPADRLWRLVESERVSVLGLSPTLVRALIPHGDPERRPLVAAGVRDDRRALEPRSVPLALRARRRRTVRRSSTCSGGTEVGACFLSPLGRDPDQGLLARRPGARDGDGRRRRGGQAGARRRWASLSAASRSRA